ncbi:MAG: hypothetical protein U1F58_08360 [Burkholderiales bacterium]
MTFDAFLETAWNDHGDRPDEVADRLAASTAVITAASHVAPYARIVAHVYGEHLGAWQRGLDLLHALRALPAAAGDAGAEAAIARSIATLRVASGDEAAAAPLAGEDRVSVLAAVAATLAGRGEFERAIAAYADALAHAARGLPDGSPALRALAVGGNNLAASLEEKRDRSARETEGMLAAAEGGLTYWRRAGTWLEEERALYRLARSLLAAGRPQGAVGHAQACVSVCAAHDAPPFERFFADAILAVALRAAGDADGFAAARAAARRHYEQVPADERTWCAADLAELDG